MADDPKRSDDSSPGSDAIMLGAITEAELACVQYAFSDEMLMDSDGFIKTVNEFVADYEVRRLSGDPAFASGKRPIGGWTKQLVMYVFIKWLAEQSGTPMDMLDTRMRDAH